MVFREGEVLRGVETVIKSWKTGVDGLRWCCLGGCHRRGGWTGVGRRSVRSLVIVRLLLRLRLRGGGSSF